jgi:hypothetical protein
MAAEVIETEHRPPLWSVKVRNRIRVMFTGADVRQKAEAHAAESFGEFTVVTKPIPHGKELRRAAALAEKTIQPSPGLAECRLYLLLTSIALGAT